MNSLNVVTVMGNIGQKPTLKEFGEDKSVLNLSLAHNRRRQDGEYEADWFKLVAWNKTAELMAEKLDKGSRVIIIGELRTNSYEAEDGTQKQNLEIHVSQFFLMA